MIVPSRPGPSAPPRLSAPTVLCPLPSPNDHRGWADRVWNGHQDGSRSSMIPKVARTSRMLSLAQSTASRKRDRTKMPRINSVCTAAPPYLQHPAQPPTQAAALDFDGSATPLLTSLSARPRARRYSAASAQTHWKESRSRAPPMIDD